MQCDRALELIQEIHSLLLSLLRLTIVVRSSRPRLGWRPRHPNASVTSIESHFSAYPFRVRMRFLSQSFRGYMSLDERMFSSVFRASTSAKSQRNEARDNVLGPAEQRSGSAKTVSLVCALLRGQRGDRRPCRCDVGPQRPKFYCGGVLYKDRIQNSTLRYRSHFLILLAAPVRLSPVSLTVLGHLILPSEHLAVSYQTENVSWSLLPEDVD